MDRETLEGSLGIIGGSLYFLTALVGSLLLSWLALRGQRAQVADLLAGGTGEEISSVFPLRLGASAIVIGALGYFLQVAMDRQERAMGGSDPAEARSAWRNAYAGALVLGAALVRLVDLLAVEGARSQALLDQQVQPPV